MVKGSARDKVARRTHARPGLAYIAGARHTRHRDGGLRAPGAHTDLVTAPQRAGWPVQCETVAENVQDRGSAGPARLTVGRADQVVAPTSAAGRMSAVTDMRRSAPEPPAGPPKIQLEPGMAKELLHELAPLLAEEGIDVNNIEVPDLETLRRAMDRAVERQNMARFTPVGQARDLAAATLRLAVEAIAEGDSVLAGTVLDQAQPESPDNAAATVAGCIGLALGLLDEWLSGRDPQAPARLAQQVRLPAGHWFGERAATDILALAAKGKAFRSLDRVIARQGGKHVLFGSALALAATIQAWSQRAQAPVPDLARTAIR
jgi:hypothetical protein